MKSGKWIRSTCKMCIHSCGTIVHVTDDGVINKIEGDLDNPDSKVSRLIRERHGRQPLPEKNTRPKVYYIE